MIMAPPLLDKLTNRFLAVLVEMYESPSAYLSAQLFDEHVDLSVLVDKLPSAALAGEPLVDELLYFVRARRAETPCETVGIAELVDVPMILTTRATTLRHMVDAQFASLGITPRVMAEASSIQTLLTVVAQGRLGTFMPYSALAWPALSQMLEIKLLSPSLSRHATLAWSKTAALTEATRCVRALIFEVSRDLVADGRWKGATLLATLDKTAILEYAPLSS